MKIEELASLMKISKNELIEQLKNNHIIELKLTEKENKEPKDNGTIEIMKIHQK